VHLSDLLVRQISWPRCGCWEQHFVVWSRHICVVSDQFRVVILRNSTWWHFRLPYKAWCSTLYLASVHAHSLVLINRSARVCLCAVCLIDWLRVGCSGDRIPLGGGRFSLPTHNGPEAHFAFCMVYVRSLAGLKWPERDAGQPYLSSFEDASELNLYLCACVSKPWGDLMVCL